MEDTFIDAMDGTVTAEINDNADGEFIILSLLSDEHGSVGMAINAEQAQAMAYTLNVLAAGL